MKRRTWLTALVGLIVVVVAVAIAIGAFSGDDGNDGDGPGPGPTASGASTPSAGTAQDLASKYLTTTPEPAVASAAGTLEMGGTEVPAKAEMLAVTSGAGSTVLRWRLTAERIGTLPPALFTRGSTDADTSGIALVSERSQQRLIPGRYVQGVLNRCACSNQPYQVGPRGVEMSAVFAALPETVTQVEVRIPTFPAVTVPVTRS
jgi:hypothetical protein